MNRCIKIFLGCAIVAYATMKPALGDQLATPVVTLKTVVEDRQPSIVATMTVAGKPVENATVAFFVRRSFGTMLIGKDQTLDDGTAAVPFPSGLPGGATGQLQVLAKIMAPTQYTSTVAEATIPGGVIVPQNAEAFPRALWAPRAPMALIVTIIVLLGSAWGSFFYVVAQLTRIRKGEAAS